MQSHDYQVFREVDVVDASFHEWNNKPDITISQAVSIKRPYYHGHSDTHSADAEGSTVRSSVPRSASLAPHPRLQSFPPQQDVQSSRTEVNLRVAIVGPLRITIECGDARFGAVESGGGV